MSKKSFYVDACIYLNLWQQEGDDRFGIPYWKIALDFFEKFDGKDAIFYFSGFLLKELEHILSKEEFQGKRALFESSPNFKRLYLSDKELKQARKIESDMGYEISFYDIIHMLLAKKSKSILVTRDRKLLDVSRRYGVEADKPEDLL